MREERRQKILMFKKPEKGFTLLFSLLVSTLVLTVGASIISISLRQLVISSTGRDSQYAFYAANTGIECAMYWDLIGSTLNQTFFATSSESVQFSGSFFCQGIDLGDILGEPSLPSFFDEDNPYFISKGPNSATTGFRLYFDGGRSSNTPMGRELPYCVDVTVEKITDITAPSIKTETVINSRGYNTCDPQNPRRIERGLRVEY